MEEMSTEMTLAPSFANMAANGLPTVSDLFIRVSTELRGKRVLTYLLMTITVFPSSLLPNALSKLYTSCKLCKTRITARGVQG